MKTTPRTCHVFFRFYPVCRLEEGGEEQGSAASNSSNTVTSKHGDFRKTATIARTISKTRQKTKPNAGHPSHCRESFTRCVCVQLYLWQICVLVYSSSALSRVCGFRPQVASFLQEYLTSSVTFIKLYLIETHLRIRNVYLIFTLSIRRASYFYR